MDKPLNPMDKQLIAARFAKARNTYTREARVQQQVAEKMMQLIKEPYTRFRRVVEFGCGTGSYSRILLHFPAQVVQQQSFRLQGVEEDT